MLAKAAIAKTTELQPHVRRRATARPAVGECCDRRKARAAVVSPFNLLTRAEEVAAPWLPIRDGAYKSAPDGATWRSGYATVCKTVYTSSILVVASNLSH
jgi:hypothetical protein